MTRWPLAWLVVVALVVFAYRWQLPLGFTDTDALADYVAAGQPLAHQLTMPLTDGVAGANANFYRPVVNLHYWALRAVFGDWTVGWQAWDLALHVLCVLGVGAVVRAAGGQQRTALAAGALVGLHPLGVEIVPAVARNIDLLMTGFVLLAAWATLTRRLALATVACLLAIGTKEAALAVAPMLPVAAWLLYGRRSARNVGVPLVVGLGVWFLARSWVLSGLGGYHETVLQLGGLERILRMGTLELVAPGFGHHFVDLPWAAQLGLGLAATAVALLGAWHVRDQRGALVGLVFAVLPLLLLGVLGLIHRRLLYLPMVGWCVVLAYLFEHRMARWPALSSLGLLLTYSPLFHPDEDWSLADELTASGMAARDEIAELPTASRVWMVDRCIRVNADPVRAVWFREGQSQTNCVGSYSLRAYVNEVRPDIEVLQITATYPDGSVAPPQIDTDGRTLVITRPVSGRFVFKAARTDGWDVQDDGDTLRLQMDAPDNDWILVLGGGPASLVRVP